MKKIKVKSENKIVGKEFNPIDFFYLYKTRIIRIGVSIGVVILCLWALWIWQENQRADAVVVLTQARGLFSEAKYESSLEMYKKFLKQFPRHGLTPASLLGVAYCYEELGKIDEAKKTFLDVQNRFPDSPWNDDAVRGIERLGESGI